MTPLSQIYLFIGENTYLLRAERKRWIEEFCKKYGEENCSRLDGAKLKMYELLDEISVMPFLSEKRLVVVDTVLKCTREDVQSFVQQIHPQVVLLFCDPKPDKRLTGVKELLEVADVKTFAPLKPKELSAWMQTYAKQQGTSLAAGSEQTLIEYLGEDMNLIAHEIDKLALLKSGAPITKDDVDAMTIPSDEGIVWKMTDFLCAGLRLNALKFAKRTLDRGGDAYGLWAILLSMLKNVVLVHAALDMKMTNGKAIAEKTGVHPFALRSLQPYAARIKPQALRPFVGWAVRSERDLKTGILKATDEAPQEVQALIDQFILKCP